jgi:hypothetical protein
MDYRACSTGVYGCFLPVCGIAGLPLQLTSPVLTVIVMNKLITSLEGENQVYFLMQAAVIDLLTAGKLPGMDSRGVAKHLRSQFLTFMTGSMLHCLGDAPKHAPGVYLDIWRALEEPAGHDASTGLDARRSDARQQVVCFLDVSCKFHNSLVRLLRCSAIEVCSFFRFCGRHTIASPLQCSPAQAQPLFTNMAGS